MNVGRMFCVAAIGADAIGLGCGRGTSAPPAPAREIEVALPAPATSGPLALEQALASRRSARDFRDEPLALGEIGQLAWAAQGLTEAHGTGRTAPSAGALYPLEVYLVAPDGVFRYLPAGHRLARVRAGDVRAALAGAALGQQAVRSAALDVVIVGVLERTRAKYGSRAERYVDIEAGHVAQNVLLEATALGLGAVPVGALDDSAVADVLGLPPGYAPRYLIAVGRPR